MSVDGVTGGDLVDLPRCDEQEAFLDHLRFAFDQNVIATVLYGSYARGTQTQDSDIDVLQIVSRQPGNVSRGKVNLTRYTSNAFEALVSRSSLFVLHLKTDSRIISDTDHVYRNLLSGYSPPESYMPLLEEVRLAAAALRKTPDRENFVDSLHKLGIYLARTALYARLASLGKPIFDVDLACAEFKSAEVTDALRLRNSPARSTQNLDTILLGVEKLVGELPPCDFSTTEDLILSSADSQSLHGQLLTNLLFSNPAEIDYASLVPPML